MSRYLIINACIIIFPLLFSFEKQLTFARQWRHVFFSVSIVGTIFIVWDIAATLRGDWGFNPLYVHGITLFSLPYEEWLFFITVPYSLIFTYEVIGLYIGKFFSARVTPVAFGFGNKVPALFKPALVLTLAAITSALLTYPRYYTFTILLFLAVSVLLFALSTNLMLQKTFILTLAISYIPFFAVNYALTSAPIVWYSPSAIIGWRISTIPVEDFIYSLVMVALWLYLYTFSKQRLKTR